ncbi:hypothetical protein [Ancylobacter oerskovii]|uniref:Uncharacterized protein n=1 Tax=Ancylobacter oerskovii TaxID=459519 RepID=A0ABW4Z1C5_9HYPH|nr:hypothetical protein [Ancylobacter oerskovii]MBS7542524.1 hypothetical protein [Ancylobacter oerskovii]
MAVRTRIEPIDRDTRAIIAADLSPEAQSQALAAFANEQLAEAQQMNTAALGYLPAHTTYVDGAEGRPVADVKPDGSVVFVFDLVDDALTWIGEQLVKHSPVLRGTYAASHVLLADGVEVTPGEPIPAAEVYVFINSQPYARKIEKGLSQQAPHGVYEAVAVLAAQRFGNVVRIGFTWRSLVGGAVSAWAATTKMEPRRPYLKRSRKAFQDWLTRQPAIIIRTGGR